MNARDRIAAWMVAAALSVAAVLPGPGGSISRSRIRLQKSAYDRGQASIIQLFLGITIAVIVGVGVVIPLMNDQMASTNFTNTMTETVIGYIPLFIGLLLLVGVAAPIMRRV
jgi:hypothetical protein